MSASGVRVNEQKHLAAIKLSQIGSICSSWKKMVTNLVLKSQLHTIESPRGDRPESSLMAEASTPSLRCNDPWVRREPRNLSLRHWIPRKEHVCTVNERNVYLRETGFSSTNSSSIGKEVYSMSMSMVPDIQLRQSLPFTERMSRTGPRPMAALNR